MTSRVAVLWRRLLVLLIGGVIAVPYLAVIIWMVTAWNQLEDRASALAIIGIGIFVLGLLCIPAFLAAIRALERTLAEQLLELSIPIPPRRPLPADRVRGALFYFGHALTGALLLCTVVVLVPFTIVLTLDPEQARELSGGLVGTEPGSATVVLPGALIQILTPALLLLCVGFTVAGGYFLPHCALILLGPSPSDRADLAGRERARRFRRTVLAREVHDSIGHALTVTTMQAAVAKRSIHSNPDLAEAAVDEIARTGREAVAELDHVLALLRAQADAESPDAESAAGDAPGTPPSGDVSAEEERLRTMRDIDVLVQEARSVGHPAQMSASGDAQCLPPMLVHELHRIVREALTNSLRHASAPGILISIVIEQGSVSVVTKNAARTARAGEGRADGGAAEPSGRPSRGLVGIRERVELFGGTVEWGMDSGEWILEAVLPIDGRAVE